MTTRIGFSTPKRFNPLSWLVRRISKSRASHTFFIYHDLDFDFDMVMEAHELNFRLIPFEHFEEKNKIIKVVTPKNPIDKGLKVVARRYLDTMYDYPGLLGMSVVKLGKWLHRKWKNPFGSTQYVFCSESVIIAINESPGYELLRLDPNSDPEEVLQYFETVEGA